jgi:RNA recognition motif-containing protein
VDNVANDVTDADLRMLFELFGKVQSMQLNDRQNWAIVEMSSKSAGKEAIENLNGQNLKGIDLSVSEMNDSGPRRISKPRRRLKRR